MKTPNLNISVIQSDIVWKDKSRNLSNYSNKILALEKPSDLIILPEMFTTGFCTEPSDIAEQIEGSTFEWMAKLAEKTLAVIVGSIITEINGAYYNTLIWMKPNGLYSLYHKRHLFSIGKEDEYLKPGKSKIIEDILGWKICPLICYDLRFPVWSKNTYAESKYQYDLLIYIANWPEPRTDVFRKLLQARAIENLSYVVGVNRVGSDGNNLNYIGNSAVIDYKGNIMHELVSNKEEIIESYIVYNQLSDFRERFNIGQDWDNFLIEI